jgi:pesticin/yersiniabactin receptor
LLNIYFSIIYPKGVIMQVKKVVLSLLSIMASANVLAQERAADAARDELTLETITVTATKREQSALDVAGSVAVQTPEQLRTAVVNNTDELNLVFPELASMGRSSRIYNNLTLRGQASADYYGPSTAFYVDGVPQLPHAYAQSIQELEQVELFKGPQGAIYGRGALGGVLSVHSRRPGQKAEFWSHLQGFGRGQRVQAGASSGFGASGWAVQANVTDARENGTLDDPARNRHDVDDRSTTGGRVSLHYISPTLPLESRLKFGGERYRSNEEYYIPFSPLSRSQIVAARETSWLERKVRDVTWDLNYALSEQWDITAILGHQNVDLDRTIGTFSFGYVEKQESDYGELRANYQGERLTAVMGASAQRLEFEVTALSSGGSGSHTQNEINNYALFADGSYRLARQWELSAGARLAREEAKVTLSGAASLRDNDRFTAFTPRLALAWLPDDHHRFWLGAGRGFKPGGFNKAGVSAADVVSYKSEIATNYEAGWKWRAPDNRHRAEITLYATNNKEVQGYVGPMGRQVLANMGKAEHRGIEFAWKSVIAPRHEITLGGMVNRSRYASGEHDGNRVAFAPGNSVLLAWDGKFGSRQQILSRLAARRTGAYYFDPENQLRQSAYTIIDAALTWRAQDGLEIGLYGRNLGDKLYRVYADRFGAQPGAPREIGVQLHAGF